MTNRVTRQAWVDLVSDEDAYTERARGDPYDFGFALGMSKLIMAHPRIARLWGPLYAEIMFAEAGAWSRTEREMVAAVAAAAQDCRY
jgi:hypothetical protein